jgi:hypothetical protein
LYALTLPAGAPPCSVVLICALAIPPDGWVRGGGAVGPGVASCTNGVDDGMAGCVGTGPVVGGSTTSVGGSTTAVGDGTTWVGGLTTAVGGMTIPVGLGKTTAESVVVGGTIIGVFTATGRFANAVWVACALVIVFP